MIPEANPRKTKGLRALGAIDIAALCAAVKAIPEAVWDAENTRKPNKFDVLGATRHIVFRFIESPCDWRGDYDCPWWQDWRGLLEPVMAQAVADYGYSRGAFPRVMLARLPAGGAIHPHIDANPAAKWPHKIHVPLITDPRVICCFGGEQRHFPAGDAVEVNNLDAHWVNNGADSDRVHLIFEYYDAAQPEPDWLERLLRTGAAD
jgi:hypothetical protein